MNPSLQQRLTIFRHRAQTNSELRAFYLQEVRNMEIELHQETSVFSALRRNILGKKEVHELFTPQLNIALDIVRTHDVLDMGTRWSWKHLDFVHYVQYK